MENREGYYIQFDAARCIDESIPTNSGIDVYFNTPNGKVPFNLASGKMITDRHPITLEKLDAE